MGIETQFTHFQDWLKGRPNSILTVILLGLALFLVVVALRATPLEKAVVASWMILP